MLIEHVYIKLDFLPLYENARSAEDARGFLRSVSRAAKTSHDVAKLNGGMLLEVQGSTLHVGILPTSLKSLKAMDFVGDLHGAFRVLFDGAQSRIDGWRITVDAGNTLLVAGRGVHGDESLVSLGKAANRPAKHLYQQLELAESDRNLKRFYVGLRNPQTDRWRYIDLNKLPQHLEEAKSIAKEAREAEPKLDFVEAASGWKPINAQAIPIAPAGTPDSPSARSPHTYFGWVMRADLDGFTSRVEQCFDNAEKLKELASEFYCIMDAAAQFTEQHSESLAQLPWAGDNFTAAAVFDTKANYDEAIPKRLVELSLDFQKEMAEAADVSGFGGWAYGVAGGIVHGNSGGNVYLAGVEVGERRFLVGAGEGFGRSAQAFGDINPKAEEVVIYDPDCKQLQELYKNVFKPAVNVHGQQSSLYHVANADALVRVRARQGAVGTATIVSMPDRKSRMVAPRPHFR